MHAEICWLPVAAIKETSGEHDNVGECGKLGRRLRRGAKVQDDEATIYGISQ